MTKTDWVRQFQDALRERTTEQLADQQRFQGLRDTILTYARDIELLETQFQRAELAWKDFVTAWAQWVANDADANQIRLAQCIARLDDILGAD